MGQIVSNIYIYIYDIDIYDILLLIHRLKIYVIDCHSPQQKNHTGSIPKSWWLPTGAWIQLPFLLPVTGSRQHQAQPSRSHGRFGLVPEYSDLQSFLMGRFIISLSWFIKIPWRQRISARIGDIFDIVIWFVNQKSIGLKLKYCLI